ncbi:unnamed protein product [Moneuplotes crassus]|uniref:B box-type domain-containing protein n=1 Tax=Euplotes crassus TaxID=5936 RepID=A0AAD1U1C8_EUPCR|nr:unnamed protein product [Moneuplotes crassus]
MIEIEEDDFIMNNSNSASQEREVPTEGMEEELARIPDIKIRNGFTENDDAIHDFSPVFSQIGNTPEIPNMQTMDATKEKSGENRDILSKFNKKKTELRKKSGNQVKLEKKDSFLELMQPHVTKKPTSKVDKKELMCEVHKGSYYEYYCNDCKTLICTHCLFQTHNGHNLVQFSDVINDVSKSVEQFRNTINKARKTISEQTEFGERSLAILEKQKDIQMDKIERSFTKIQQLVKERKSDLKKFYNNSYNEEKKRISDQLKTIKKDIIKIESIEKTWEKAISIIKSRSTLYLLKRIDYIDGFISSYHSYMAGIYKGQNFDLDNFKLNNKLRCKEVPIEDISAAIKRICFYYKKSRMEDNTYFNSNVPADPIEKEAFRLTKSPNLKTNPFAKPPLHVNSDSERVKSDLKYLYRTNKIPSLKHNKKGRNQVQKRSSPLIMNAGRKISSVGDSSKEDATITMLDRYKSVQKGPESLANSSDHMSTKKFALTDVNKQRVRSEDKLKIPPPSFLTNPDQTTKALQYLVNISDRLQTLNGTLEKMKEENNALKKLEERKNLEKGELPKLKSVSGDTQKHVVKKNSQLRYRIDRPKQGKLQIKKVDGNKLKSSAMKVSDIGKK